MPIATYQKKAFQVSTNRLYTFDGLEWSTGLNTESQDKVQDKPSTYIKGQSLKTLSLEIQLQAAKNLDVRKEIEEWEAICEKGTADIFILGTKPLAKNKWLLKSVAVSDTAIDGKGRLLKAKLKLALEEYVRAGTSAASSSSAAGVSTDMTADSYIDKESSKRENPNAELVAAVGFKKAHNYAMGV